MIKKNKVIGLAAIIALSMAFGVGLFAQESNTHIATFGRIGNDVDAYLDSADWSTVELNNFFAFGRIGANIKSGWVDTGAAFKANSLYLGAYVKMNVTGLQYDDSLESKVDLVNGSGDVKDTVTVRATNKLNPHAFYGALVGIKDLGIKFTYTDELEVTGTAAGGTWTENYFGTVTPYVELGGSLGPFSYVGLGTDIAYNRVETSQRSGTSAMIFNSRTLGVDNSGNQTAIGSVQELVAADGNYVAPFVYFGLGLGDFWLDNTLEVPIYAMPSHKKDGKADFFSGGVALVNAVYDADNSNAQTFAHMYDARFRMWDEVVPSYGFKGGNDKFTFKGKAKLPILIDFAFHSVSAITENSSATAEVKDFYKAGDFNISFKPEVQLGVQVKPIPAVSLQGGVDLKLFDYAIESTTTTKVTLDAAQTTQLGGAATALGVTAGASTDATATVHSFTLPELSWAAGFTVYYKAASLDFVFLYKGNPGLAASIYEAVGNGLGSSETSVVLSIKL